MSLRLISMCLPGAEAEQSLNESGSLKVAIHIFIYLFFGLVLT